MRYNVNILILPGDHIGPEITSAALRVLERVNDVYSLRLNFETMEVGLAALPLHRTTLPDSVVTAAREAAGVVLGPASMTYYPPVEQGGINVPGAVRRLLDLYANIRPSRARAGMPDARPGLDLVMVRENTEGFYADRNMFLGHAEVMPTPDLALSIRKITAHASKRIARTAFDLARRRRRKVTAVHKETVLKMTDGLFMREVRAMAAQYPDVTFEGVMVDTMAALLYHRPDQFDVVVITNMFGDILSNEAAAMSGGLGLAAALNAGDDHAAANAAHGSAPDIAGQDKANPTSLMLSSGMLLDWLGTRHSRPDLSQAAVCIDHALDAVLADPATRTGDLGGPLGTRAFSASVVAQIERSASSLAHKPLARAAESA